jgi:uncharacterized protein YndB with AHSA1/START domain
MTSAFQSGVSGTGGKGRGSATLAKAKPSLIIKRRFNVSAERVYAAWTDPEKVRQWFHCGDATVTDAAFDVRIGGHYTIATRKASGEENRASGVYRDVLPDRKLVFTWTHDRNPEAETLVTVLITPDGSGCYLTLTHEMFADEETRDLHNNGWTGCLDNLEAYLAA